MKENQTGGPCLEYVLSETIGRGRVFLFFFFNSLLQIKGTAILPLLTIDIENDERSFGFTLAFHHEIKVLSL